VGKVFKRQTHGHKFRRQHPLGLYIADFYCHKLKIVIEVDGKIHEQKEVAENDIERQRSIESNGIAVIRFTNENILKQFETVVEKINEFIINRKSQDIDGSKKPL
jgi:imidazole glycerol-phosphate synthase subunit HisF